MSQLVIIEVQKHTIKFRTVIGAKAELDITVQIKIVHISNEIRMKACHALPNITQKKIIGKWEIIIGIATSIAVDVSL